MAPETAVRVLVVPVFKRYWLWHAWKIAAPVSTTPQKPWQQGKDLQEKAQLFLAGIQRWGSKQGEQQWHKLATAPEGTFNHKLFRYRQSSSVLGYVSTGMKCARLHAEGCQILWLVAPGNERARPESGTVLRLSVSRCLQDSRQNLSTAVHDAKQHTVKQVVRGSGGLLTTATPCVVLAKELVSRASPLPGVAVWSHRGRGGGCRAMSQKVIAQ
jgi:hypothetical protein